jgi:hypothetical protein
MPCARRGVRIATPVHPEEILWLSFGNAGHSRRGRALVGRGPPQRPHSVSSNTLHIGTTNVGFTLHRTGYWLDCWFDKDSNVDRCRLTDAKGTGLFEDVFLPCAGQAPLPQSELIFDARWTGDKWIRSDKGINIPIVYLEYGRALLPRSLYAEARQDAGCSADLGSPANETGR